MAQIFPFGKYEPTIDPEVFVAPTATIIGRVTIARGASVWFGAVLRGDLGEIQLGEGCVVEDNCVIHAGTTFGKNVLVGHSAVIEQSQLADGVLIGSGSLLFEGVEIGAGSMVAAGSVVRGPVQIPPGVLVAGAPATVKKELGGAAGWWVATAARTYGRLARAYDSGFSDDELAEMSAGPVSRP